MNLRNLAFALMILGVSCSKAVVEPTIPSTPEVVEEKDTENPCRTFSKLTPSEKEQAETAYVLFRDYIKMDNYDEASRYWKKAYELAPAANGRAKYQFDDGVKIYKHFYNQTQDESEKNAIVDTIMMIYDKRAECFDQEAYVDGRKAFDYYYSFSNHISKEENFSLFRKAIDNSNEIDYFVINPFTKLLYESVIEEKISYEEGSAYAKKLLARIKSGKEKCEKDCETWAIIDDYTPPMLESLEGLKGFYTCDYYIDKYYSQFDPTSEDCDLLNSIGRKLLWGGCPKDSPEVQKLAEVKNSKCYTPPPPGQLSVCFDAYRDGNFKEAIACFETYINNTDDMEKKAKYNLLIGKIYYGELKNFSKSREYARKAISQRPNWGDPYMLIGKLYASSGPLCGPGRGWDSQVVTWPAIDKFEQAKKVDPSVSAEANKWINTYSQYMPSREDVFSRRGHNGIDFGKPYKVGCWIQENTIIRTRD